MNPLYSSVKVLDDKQREYVEVKSFMQKKVLTGDTVLHFDAPTRLRGTIFDDGERICYWNHVTSRVRIMDVESGELEDSIDVGMDNVYGVIFFKSKGYLVLSGRGLEQENRYTINLLDPVNRVICGTLTGVHTAGINVIRELPESILISGGYDMKLVIWDLQIPKSTYTPKLILEDYKSSFRDFCYIRSMTNTVCSVGGEVPGEKELYSPRLWDYIDGKYHGMFGVSHEWATFCCSSYMKNGKEYVVSAGFVKFCVWDVSSRTLVKEVGENDDDEFDMYAVSMLNFNSRYLAVMNCDDTMRLWDLDENKVIGKSNVGDLGRVGFSSTIWWKDESKKEIISFNDTIVSWELESNYDNVLSKFSDEMERLEFIRSNDIFFTFTITFLKIFRQNDLIMYKCFM